MVKNLSVLIVSRVGGQKLNDKVKAGWDVFHNGFYSVSNAIRVIVCQCLLLLSNAMDDLQYRRLSTSLFRVRVLLYIRDSSLVCCVLFVIITDLRLFNLMPPFTFKGPRSSSNARQDNYFTRKTYSSAVITPHSTFPTVVGSG